MDKRILIGGATVLIILGVLFFPKANKSKDQEPAAAVVQPKKDTTGSKLYDEASRLKQDGEIVRAQEVYQEILTDHADFHQIEKVQKELEDVSMKLILSNTPVENKTVIHKVVSGDTLGELSKKYGTTIELIKISNNLSSNVIRIGQNLRIWTGTFNIFVDKSQNILMLKDGDSVIKVYSVSTGGGNSTPIGEFKIVSRLVDPVWFNKGIVVPPESPQNVLGTRWLGFDLPGYGIHGTIDPATIGQQVTAGCVRMRNHEVEELFNLIPRGVKVVVVD